MERREFILSTLLAGAGSMLLPGCKGNVPSFLRDYEDTWLKDPRKATLEWFKDTRFGMFLHYGLYSLLGRHEWVQFREKIPIQEYARLTEQFTADIGA